MFVKRLFVMAISIMAALASACSNNKVLDTHPLVSKTDFQVVTLIHQSMPLGEELYTIAPIQKDGKRCGGRGPWYCQFGLSVSYKYDSRLRKWTRRFNTLLTKGDSVTVKVIYNDGSAPDIWAFKSADLSCLDTDKVNTKIDHIELSKNA